MTAAINGAGRPLERVVAALERAGCRRGGPASWTCPSHQDHNPSLSVRAADDGAVLLCCHAGCPTEDVVFALGLQMADLFSGRDDRAGGEDWTPRGPAVASYRYTDEDGRLLYCVCRTADKQFPSWRPDPTSKTGKRWALTDKTGKWLVRRVLYRLPKVLEAAAAGGTVWVVEGEKDVHALERAGQVATTNQGGASGPWLDAYTEALAGAHVVVVGDRDGPDPKHPRNSYKGQRRARHVARKLRSRAASVRMVMAAQGKDAADHLAAGLGTDDFVDLPANDPPAEGQPSEQAAIDRDVGTTTRGRNGGGDGGEPERSTATELVALAEARYQLGTSSTGEPYAVARPGHGPHVARMLRGGQASLRAELAATFAQLHQRAPASSALADALLVLEGRAMNTQPVEPALRVARHRDGLVLDLGDPTGQVVVLTPAGWQLAERSPVLFRRTKATGTLPPPQPGGRLEELRERRLVNLTDTSWPLALAWLVAALVPDIPHPIPLLCGEQGTGKSTTAKMLARLVDPSPAELRTGPKDLEQWAVAAAGSWLVVLDNISGVAPWLSDALCRAVTGDGLVRRRLYENDDLTVLKFRRVVALTSIDPGALRGDLADRIVLFDLERLRRRAEERQQEHDFHQAWPRLLGALLDLACNVLRVLPEVHVADAPRMADFARIVAATDRVLGTNALSAYRALSERIAADVVEADPVAEAVRKLAEAAGTWQGTASELLAKLTAELGEQRPPRSWPATPRGMTAALTRAAPALRQVGVRVEQAGRQGHDRQRVWWLSVDPAAQAPTSLPPLGLDAAANPSGPQDMREGPSAPSAPSADQQTPSSAGTDQGHEVRTVARTVAEGAPQPSACETRTDRNNRPQPSADRPHPIGAETPGQTGYADGADGADGPGPLSLARGGSPPPPKAEPADDATPAPAFEWTFNHRGSVGDCRVCQRECFSLGPDGTPHHPGCWTRKTPPGVAP
jgi:energy-coupling factor transporter ATP-binding protein EcfA2